MVIYFTGMFEPRGAFNERWIAPILLCIGIKTKEIHVKYIGWKLLLISFVKISFFNCI